MAARGRLSNESGTLSLASFEGPERRLELAIKILDEYIRYPLPSRAVAAIPWNYCAAARLVRSLASAAGRLMRIAASSRCDCSRRCRMAALATKSARHFGVGLGLQVPWLQLPLSLVC